MVHTFKTHALHEGTITAGSQAWKRIALNRDCLQLDKMPTDHRVLHMSCSDSAVLPTSRSFTTYQFHSHCERERFAACINTAASLEVSAASNSTDFDSHTAALHQAASKQALLNAAQAEEAGLLNEADSNQPPPAHFGDWSRLFVGTFNVGGTLPPTDLSELAKWLPEERLTEYSMIVLAFQETEKKGDEWSNAVMKYLANSQKKGGKKGVKGKGGKDKDFKLVASVTMWEMHMMVAVSRDLIPAITHIEHTNVPTGITIGKGVASVQIGNKGGCIVSLRVSDTTLCFVCCHLAARPERIKKREDDYRAIIGRSCAHLGQHGTELTHQFDHVFWVGDLNYRVDIPFGEVIDLTSQRQWSTIAGADQLRKEQRAGRSFLDFNEAQIQFAPTYRWQRGEHVFSDKRKQSPSYCDRVLFRSQKGLRAHLRCVEYTGVHSMMQSDHRPVASEFDLFVRKSYALHSLPTAGTPDVAGAVVVNDGAGGLMPTFVEPAPPGLLPGLPHVHLHPQHPRRARIPTPMIEIGRLKVNLRPSADKNIQHVQGMYVGMSATSFLEGEALTHIMTSQAELSDKARSDKALAGLVVLGDLAPAVVLPTVGTRASMAAPAYSKNREATGLTSKSSYGKAGHVLHHGGGLSDSEDDEDDDEDDDEEGGDEDEEEGPAGNRRRQRKTKQLRAEAEDGRKRAERIVAAAKRVAEVDSIKCLEVSEAAKSKAEKTREVAMAALTIARKGEGSGGGTAGSGLQVVKSAKLADGASIDAFADGTRVQRSVEGFVIVQLPDGAKVQVDPGGSEIVLCADGITMQSDPTDHHAPIILNCAQPLLDDVDADDEGSDRIDPTLVARKPQGSMIVEWHADGTICHLMADGTMVQKNEGNAKSPNAKHGKEQGSMYVTMEMSVGGQISAATAKANKMLGMDRASMLPAKVGKAKHKIIFSPNSAVTVVMNADDETGAGAGSGTGLGAVSMNVGMALSGPSIITKVHIDPNRVVVLTRSDESTLQLNPTGVLIESAKTGASVQHNPDGTTLTEYSDGRVVQHGSDGSRIARSADGMLSREANAEAEEELAFEWGAEAGKDSEGRDTAIPLLSPFMTDLQFLRMQHILFKAYSPSGVMLFQGKDKDKDKHKSKDGELGDDSRMSERASGEDYGRRYEGRKTEKSGRSRSMTALGRAHSQSVVADADMPRDPKHNPVLGQACLDLTRPINELLQKIKRAAAAKSQNEDGVEFIVSGDQGDDDSRLTETHGSWLNQIQKSSAVPFTLPLELAGRAVGTIEGEVRIFWGLQDQVKKASKASLPRSTVWSASTHKKAFSNGHEAVDVLVDEELNQSESTNMRMTESGDGYDPGALQMTGFLEKKGQMVSSWHRRWFVVSGGEKFLYYYAQNMEHEHMPFHPALMGEMSLEGAIIRDKEDEANAQVRSRFAT
jgi:hypothetical protein